MVVMNKLTEKEILKYISTANKSTGVDGITEDQLRENRNACFNQR